MDRLIFFLEQLKSLMENGFDPTTPFKILSHRDLKYFIFVKYLPFNARAILFPCWPLVISQCFLIIPPHMQENKIMPNCLTLCCISYTEIPPAYTPLHITFSFVSTPLYLHWCKYFTHLWIKSVSVFPLRCGISCLNFISTVLLKNL